MNDNLFRMMDIMKAYSEGKKIEVFVNDEWKECSIPTWNWEEYDYRVASEKHFRNLSLKEIYYWYKQNGGLVILCDENGNELASGYILGIDMTEDAVSPIHTFDGRVDVDYFCEHYRTIEGSKFIVEE